MLWKSFIFFTLFIKLIYTDWVKLPNISPATTKVTNVVFKLAPPPKNSLLSSAMITNIFSTPSSTEPNLEDFLTRKSYKRHFFQTTVTSKVVNVLGNLSNITSDEDSFEPVHLQSPGHANSNRVIHFNKTVQMNVIPLKTDLIVNKNEDKIESNNQNTDDDDDDDGVTLSDDLGVEYYDDEYYYEYDETTKFSSLKPHTTVTTPKTHKKTFNQKLQRRTMIQMMKDKDYKPFGEITFPSFIRFIKKIQESFAIRTAKSIGEKIKMLVHFRDQLMLTINRQIKRLWKIQPATKFKKKANSRKRIKRTLGMDHSHNSGAMDFPSAEGALLSICFLTFAVFLIKLVLQVIQTIKMKKAMWATQMMMGTENVVIKRQQRNILDHDELHNLTKIYESIEKLRLKY